MFEQCEKCANCWFSCDKCKVRSFNGLPGWLSGGIDHLCPDCKGFAKNESGEWVPAVIEEFIDGVWVTKAKE